MTSSFHFKPKLDYPTAFETLGALKESFEDAITRNDQALFDYLAENFSISNDQVLFIGGSYFSHSGDSNRATPAGRTQNEPEE